MEHHGTGKTTLSNKLSEIFEIPVTHIDAIHHLANWKIRDKSERDKIILDIIKEDKWIIDGTYKSTLKSRFEKADLIIWLDFSSFAQIKGIQGIDKSKLLIFKKRSEVNKWIKSLVL